LHKVILQVSTAVFRALAVENLFGQRWLSPLETPMGIPSPLRDGYPSQIFILILESLIAYFGAFWGPFCVLSCLVQQGKATSGVLGAWPPKSATIWSLM